MSGTSEEQVILSRSIAPNSLKIYPLNAHVYILIFHHWHLVGRPINTDLPVRS